jgi:hypothetical protein
MKFFLPRQAHVPWLLRFTIVLLPALAARIGLSLPDPYNEESARISAA